MIGTGLKPVIVWIYSELLIREAEKKAMKTNKKHINLGIKFNYGCITTSLHIS